MRALKPSWFLLFLIVAFTTSCSAEDDDKYIKGRKDSIPDDQKININILIIGDSFSRDAFSYVPFVMEDVYPGISVDMEILYIGGRALNYHYDYLINKKSQFVLDQYLTGIGHWVSSSDASGEDVIRSKSWDLVILQEGSNTTRSYEKTQPHIQNLSEFIHLIQNDIKVAFMLSPAKPEGSPALGSYTSDQVWEMNANTSRQLLNEEEVDYIIPCGTGIQNSRRTIVDRYGDFGHLSYDGDHLQEGLPCLIEAYVAAQTFFYIYGIDASIENCGIETTQKWVNSKHIPGKHGSAINGTPEDYRLCKRSALLAVDKPYEIQVP